MPVLALGIVSLKFAKNGKDNRAAVHDLGLAAGNLVVEPYLITLSDEAEPYPVFQHAGIEFIFMLTGAVTYRIVVHG